jgi:hypothetical protein
MTEPDSYDNDAWHNFTHERDTMSQQLQGRTLYVHGDHEGTPDGLVRHEPTINRAELPVPMDHRWVWSCPCGECGHAPTEMGAHWSAAGHIVARRSLNAALENQ